MLSRASNSLRSERVLKCSDGMKLAAVQWKRNQPSTENATISRRILCLHGWLDNAASFNLLSPHLTQHWDGDVVALDLPGHGHSSHRSQDGPMLHLSDSTFYVAEATKQLGWWNKNSGSDDDDLPLTVLGHSMGAGVAVLFAATYPELVHSLVLLEGAAPFIPRPSKDHLFLDELRNSCDQRIRQNPMLYPQNRNPTVFPTLEVAVQARMDFVSKYSPGKQYISREAATEIVTRGTALQDGGGSSVTFRHDPRLQWPSLRQFSQEQVKELLWTGVACPTYLIQTKDGWPIDPETQRTIEDMQTLKKHSWLDRGSHHFHADPSCLEELVGHLKDIF
ncbi:Serine hydrolase-like protein [Seminavis robusta]|uniref:Serine hydrolase-like protein n=1 Tax=Seminavis robusta TaxID=568900 RepID=A0A9N8EBP6_9STRA|nr:Serine hydrolase-like protein [Seminavis robusta]|eukprot:Sro858_g211780.1 Serine hydrolase-like protein (335) ;mRNA; r:3745-4749